MAYTTISDCTIHNGASDAHCCAVEAIAKALSEIAIAAQELAKAIHMPVGMTGLHLDGDHITNNFAGEPCAGCRDDDPEEDEVERDAPKEPGPWSDPDLKEASELPKAD